MKTHASDSPQLPAALAEQLDALYKPEAPLQAYHKAHTRLVQALEREKTQVLRFSQSEHALVGSLYLVIRDSKLVALNLGITMEVFLANVEKQFAARPYLEPDGFPELEAQLRQYLDGHRQTFEIETDLSILSDFQRQVLAVTSQVPHGSVISYREIAQQIGKPKAARAVGQALGRNPIPIVIPCHRVITSAGKLGGYSGGGGLTTKARLLQLEGAHWPAAKPITG